MYRSLLPQHTFSSQLTLPKSATLTHIKKRKVSSMMSSITTFSRHPAATNTLSVRPHITRTLSPIMFDQGTTWLKPIYYKTPCRKRLESHPSMLRNSKSRRYTQPLVEKGEGVATSFELWARPGHFSKTLSKGPKITSWIWNLHADAHDFDAHDENCLEKVSRKIFSAHFGQLSIIFLWISGMWFHGARFSNYSSWLLSPTTVTPSSHVVWNVVNQGILNADLGDGFAGIRVTSGWFNLWRACGITTESELYATAIVSLIMSFTMATAGWYHYHRRAPKLAFFSSTGSMLNHHLAGLLGLGTLSWSGHLIHISLPINNLLDKGVPPTEIPLPHEFIVNSKLMSDLYPSFSQGLTPFFSLNWGEYQDFLTFRCSLNPVTGSLWLSDIAHHHLAISVPLIVAGHMYRTYFGIGHSLKSILEAHTLLRTSNSGSTGAGHAGLYEILTTSWHAQLAVNLAMMGSTSIVVSHHMNAMPAYPFIGVDYATTLSLFVHHMWIGGFCIVGAGAHAAIYMVRDYTPSTSGMNIADMILSSKASIISHLTWVCIFLGAHSFGLYCHNDTLRGLGRTGGLFTDGSLRLIPLFGNIMQLTMSGIGNSVANGRMYREAGVLDPGGIISSELSTTAASGLLSNNWTAVGGTVSAISRVPLGTADFLIHHIHAFQIHVTTLVLLKGTLDARSTSLIPDKYTLGFRFPCDGPGRGGTCQVSAWDHVFLGLFWMYNTISITIFYYHWKQSSDVWGTVKAAGGLRQSGAFATCSVTVNGWLRDYLWAKSFTVINSYGTPLSAYGLIFLASHFTWAFSLMFLFSGRGFWEELIESIYWAHNKLGIVVKYNPRALSITQGRAVGVAHYLTGGIGTTWAFLLAETASR